MAKKSLQEALDAVEVTYSDINNIAKDMTKEYFQPINKIIDKIGNISDVSNSQLREYMIELGLKCFYLAEIKDKAAVKAEIAEAIRKEAYAKSFSLGEGAVAAKDTNATLESSTEVVVEALYGLISNLFKSKMVEMHGLIDTLKTILMSRMQEQKLAINTIDQ